MNATDLENYFWDITGKYVEGNDEYGNPDDRCEIDIEGTAEGLAEILAEELRRNKVELTDQEFSELTKELINFVDGVWFRGSDNVFRDIMDAEEEDQDRRRDINRLKGIE